MDALAASIFLAVVNNAEHCCTSICLIPAFTSFGYIPRSGIAGSSGNSVSLSEELPNCFPQQLHD